MIVALATLAVVGIALIALGDRLGRRAFFVGAVPMGYTTLLTASRLSRVVSGSPVADRIGWVGHLGIAVDLRLDGLAATMSLVVGGVGVLVLLYAARYFSPETPHLGRLAGLLLLFGGAMLGSSRRTTCCCSTPATSTTSRRSRSRASSISSPLRGPSTW